VTTESVRCVGPKPGAVSLCDAGEAQLSNVVYVVMRFIGLQALADPVCCRSRGLHF